MKRMIGRIWKGVYALFVAFALSFGASQAFATTALVEVCGDDPGELGYCPPYTHLTCAYDCLLIYGTDYGRCFGDGCCVCFI